ncbi:nucleoside deaminase [Nitrospira defluvii]|nr:nucleoside deaminase [Nitrospira defluvii]
MGQALAAAEASYADGEVPVGALFVSGGTIITAYNQKEAQNDPTAHAEILALREGAKRLGRWRLGGTLYTTCPYWSPAPFQQSPPKKKRERVAAQT